MKNIKITIIGNSVALRTRPSEIYPLNKNYCKYLEEILNKNLSETNIIVTNKALGATTIYNSIINIDNFVNTFPEFFIINLGVVDASTREIPLWFYRLASSKKDSFFYNVIKFLYRVIIIKFRPFLVRLRFKRSWMSSNQYKKYFTGLIKSLTKETNAKIIVLPINIANERVENELPGSTKKHKEYNKIMFDIVNEYSHNYIDLSCLVSKKHYPDGVHYSIEGHKLVARKISEIILNIVKDE